MRVIIMLLASVLLLFPGCDASPEDSSSLRIIASSFPCYDAARAVTGGKAEVIVFDDGTTSVYRYIIYMDRDCKDFKKDEQVRVSRKDGSILVEAKVLGFQRGQLNARIWV